MGLKKQKFSVHSCGCLTLMLFLFLLISLAVGDTELCGGILGSETGTIKSPGFPAEYPNNIFCVWFINLPTHVRSIKFKVTYFRTDEDTDVLQFYSENPQLSTNATAIRRLSGSIMQGAKLEFQFNQLWIVFASDGEHNYNQTGFKITYRPERRPSNSPVICDDPGVPANGSRTVSTNENDNVNFHEGQVMNFHCDPGYILKGSSSIQCGTDANGTATWSSAVPSCVTPCISGGPVPGFSQFYLVPSDTNIILSPNYPSTYDKNIECIWRIEVDPNNRLNITADIFNLQGSHDYIEFWEDDTRSLGESGIGSPWQLIGNFSNSFPNYLLSTKNNVTVRFISDATTESTGFYFSFLSVSKPHCLSPPTAPNSYIYPVREFYNIDDTVTYKCLAGYNLQHENSDKLINLCTQEGWTANLQRLPKCTTDCRRWNTQTQTYESITLTNLTGVIYTPPEGVCGYSIRMNPGWIVEFTAEAKNPDLPIFVEFFDENSISHDLDKFEKLSSANISGPVRSKSNLVKIVFNTSHLTDNKGDEFVLKYTAIKTNQCNPPGAFLYGKQIGNQFNISDTVSFACQPFFELTGPSESVCTPVDESNVWHAAIPRCLGKCGGWYTLNSGLIVSPNFPLGYGQNKSCTWRITATQKNLQFKIIVSAFDISEDNFLLTLQGKSVTVDFHTQCRPRCRDNVIYTDSNILDINFHSSASAGNNSKFALKFETFDSTQCPVLPGIENGKVTVNSTAIGSKALYSCYPPYDLIGAAEITCSSSDQEEPKWTPAAPRCAIQSCQEGSDPVLRQAGIGAIASPGYPGNATVGQVSCQWIIQAIPGNQIIMHFRYVDLPKSDSASLEIFDGTFDKPDARIYPLASTSPEAKLKNLTSPNNEVMVKYVMRIAVEGYRGFYLEYGSVPKEVLTSTWIPFKTTETEKDVTSQPTAPGDRMTSKAVPKTTSVISVTPTQTPRKPIIQSSTTKTTPGVTGPPRTTPPDGWVDSTGRVSALEEEEEGHGGKVAAGIIVPLIILLIAGIVFFIWYRKKYPVRMTFGREFAKFANPIYEDKRRSTLVHEALVQNGDYERSLSVTNEPSVMLSISNDNYGFVMDDELQDSAKHSPKPDVTLYGDSYGTLKSNSIHNPGFVDDEPDISKIGDTPNMYPDVTLGMSLDTLESVSSISNETLTLADSTSDEAEATKGENEPKLEPDLQHNVSADASDVSHHVSTNPFSELNVKHDVSSNPFGDDSDSDHDENMSTTQDIIPSSYNSSIASKLDKITAESDSDETDNGIVVQNNCTDNPLPLNNTNGNQIQKPDLEDSINTESEPTYETDEDSEFLPSVNFNPFDTDDEIGETGDSKLEAEDNGKHDVDVSSKLEPDVHKTDSVTDNKTDSVTDNKTDSETDECQSNGDHSDSEGHKTDPEKEESKIEADNSTCEQVDPDDVFLPDELNPFNDADDDKEETKQSESSTSSSSTSDTDSDEDFLLNLDNINVKRIEGSVKLAKPYESDTESETEA